MQKKLTCPGCFASILPEDINIDRLIAKCRQCATVFDFDNDLKGDGRQKPEVLLPPGIEAYATPNETDLLIRWRRAKGSGLTFFTILWNIFLIPFVVLIIRSGNLAMLGALSLHLAVGIGLGYYTLALFFNTTHVNVDRYNLLIEHRPLRVPFQKNYDISVTEVKQLYVEKYIASRTNGSPDYAYRVNLILDNQRTVRMISGLRHPDQARYIEQQVERFLEIEDRPVQEEWRGV